MIVSKAVDSKTYKPSAKHQAIKIEIANPDDAQNKGNSSAGVKGNYLEPSVRLGWWTQPDGRFDPFSSAELPLKGLIEVVEVCARENFFSVEDATTLVKALQASIDKQSGDK